jgi:poly(3-hydroxybutyrate) depolymerase
MRDLRPTGGPGWSGDRVPGRASGTEVAFCTIEGGGHAWPGGNEPLQSALRPGHAPDDFDAGVLIWDFFQKAPAAVIAMRRRP